MTGDLNDLFVEICVGSLDEARLVAATGWRAIELNSALPLGGLTPSAGLVSAIRRHCPVEIVAMVRPRPGGFCYSPGEWEVLLEDARRLIDQGVDGLAFGALTANKLVDSQRVSELRQLFPKTKLVFHRAFDLTADWRSGLMMLMDLGIDRLLTSGGAATAWAGAETLRAMQSLAQGRIEIVAAGGITPENCSALIGQTGLRGIHGTFSAVVEDPGYDGAPFRFAANDHLKKTDLGQLQSLREHLQRHLAVARGEFQ